MVNSSPSGVRNAQRAAAARGRTNFLGHCASYCYAGQVTYSGTDNVGTIKSQSSTLSNPRIQNAIAMTCFGACRSKTGIPPYDFIKVEGVLCVERTSKGLNTHFVPLGQTGGPLHQALTWYQVSCVWPVDNADSQTGLQTAQSSCTCHTLLPSTFSLTRC